LLEDISKLEGDNIGMEEDNTEMEEDNIGTPTLKNLHLLFLVLLQIDMVFCCKSEYCLLPYVDFLLPCL
jgi:hypothetical protein